MAERKLTGREITAPERQRLKELRERETFLLRQAAEKRLWQDRVKMVEERISDLERELSQ